MYTSFLIIAFALLLAYKYFYTQILSKKSMSKKIYVKFAYDVVVPAVSIFVASFLISVFVTRFIMVSDHNVLKDSVNNFQKYVESEAGQKAMMAEQKKAEKENEKEQEKKIRDVRLYSNADNVKSAPIFGNPNGEVVVFEFMDYYCGHCRAVSSIIEDGLKSMPNVKLVLKPLTFMTPVSSIPAKAVVAAQKQGKADKLNHAMMSGNLMPDTKKIKSVSDAEKAVKSMIMKMAKKVGIDIKKLEKDMDSKDVEEELLRTRELAQMLQINSTPNFVIGNKIHGGAFQSVESFKQAVENSK